MLTVGKDGEKLDLIQCGWEFEILQGLPWWLSVKESVCQCGRRSRCGSWWGKISHALEQLRPCIIAIEPVLQSSGAATTDAPMCCNYGCPYTLEPVLRNERSHHKEKPARGNWRVAQAATMTQHSQK